MQQKQGFESILASSANPVQAVYESGVPRYWYNIVPYIKNELGLSIPPLLDPQSNTPVTLAQLSSFLPVELARQELNSGIYQSHSLIAIPDKVFNLYTSYRSTPLVRAINLENYFGLNKVRLYFKREDANEIGSYKLNSSYVQAYYAREENVAEFIGDTGPGNWGLGMALACREFNIPATIYMDQANYQRRVNKVRKIEEYGATVIPISSGIGTIAGSISVALEHVQQNPNNKLSLGCLTAYSALHNTVIGMELKLQLRQQDIHPDALIGVVGGGSSFSGLVFPFIEEFRNRTRFIAVESQSISSFCQGEYRYENPDAIGLMPKAKMYTLGNQFRTTDTVASGLNYHGKNPLLSLLVHEKLIEAVAYPEPEVLSLQSLFHRLEGVSPATESAYAIKGAIELAKSWQGEPKVIVFSITGNTQFPDN